MTRTKKHILVILTAIFSGILLVPAIQHAFHPLEVKSLHGDIKDHSLPTWKIRSWFNENYQDSMKKYLNDNTGFRPDLVRINNQIHYSLFNVAKGREIIIGEKNCLYGLGYIRAATGADFIGMEKIQAKMSQVKRMHVELESRGKHLVILFAPGKGSFYPEYIPERFPKVSDSTNFEYFLREAQSHNLNIFDANTWFREMKDTSRHILYPMHGIHWSVYGYSLVLDSLESHIEQICGEDIPDFQITGLVKSSNPRDTDNDMEKGCNLLWKLDREALTYPKIAYKEKGKTKPRMLAIGDSFFWNMLPHCNVLFDNLHFLYYFREDHNVKEHGKSRITDDYDLLERIEQTDIVLLVITDAQLPRFAWGFFDALEKSLIRDDQE